MSTVTEPLHAEHRELLQHVEQLKATADAVGVVHLESLRHRVDDVEEFLSLHLIPHAEAEDRALYPVIGGLMGAPEATATMSRDHVEVGRLAADLRTLRRHMTGQTLTEPQEFELRRILYGLYELVRVHFAKEEEIYLPLLEARLAPDTASRVFEEMEQAAKMAKAHATATS